MHMHLSSNGPLGCCSQSTLKTFQQVLISHISPKHFMFIFRLIPPNVHAEKFVWSSGFGICYWSDWWAKALTRVFVLKCLSCVSDCARLGNDPLFFFCSGSTPNDTHIWPSLWLRIFFWEKKISWGYSNTTGAPNTFVVCSFLESKLWFRISAGFGIHARAKKRVQGMLSLTHQSNRLLDHKHLYQCLCFALCIQVANSKVCIQSCKCSKT